MVRDALELNDPDIPEKEFWYEIVFDITERQAGRFKFPGTAEQALEDFCQKMTEQGYRYDILAIQEVSQQIH